MPIELGPVKHHSNIECDIIEVDCGKIILVRYSLHIDRKHESSRFLSMNLKSYFSILRRLKNDEKNLRHKQRYNQSLCR